MGRHIPSKRASWGPGPGAVLLQDTPTTAEHKGGPVGPAAGRWIPEGSLAHCSSSARLARPVPVRLGVGLQCGGLCGSKCRYRLLALETDLVQGGLVSQGPGLPEREERRAELWVLEEL